MKKVFAILAVLSLLMVPCVSMAATMSDADLADVTGQMGVTILVSNLEVSLNIGTITWGDLDGFSGAPFAGYANMVIPLINIGSPFTMHIAVNDLSMTIDVGTYAGTKTADPFDPTGRTGVRIGIAPNTVITVDAISAFIFLNGEKGSEVDYGGDTAAPYNQANYSAPGAYAAEKLIPIMDSDHGGTYVNGASGNSGLSTDCLGVIGISHIRVGINSLSMTIMPH
jgi:hypothetical protein